MVFVVVPFNGVASYPSLVGLDEKNGMAPLRIGLLGGCTTG